MNLLRSDVIAGADDVAHLVFLDEGGGIFVEKAGQAHVEDFHDPLAIDEKIAWLDVAMHQPGFMSMLQSECGLADVMGDALRAQGAVAADEIV